MRRRCTQSRQIVQRSQEVHDRRQQLEGILELEGSGPWVSDSKALARITGRAKDSAKIDGTQPAPLDKDQEKRFERIVRDEEKKDIFPKKHKETRLLATLLDL